MPTTGGHSNRHRKQRPPGHHGEGHGHKRPPRTKPPHAKPPPHGRPPPHVKPPPHPRPGKAPPGLPAAASGASAGAPGAAAAGLVILLDNRSGLLTAPNLYSLFTLTRGLVINGVQYGQSAGVWFVTGFRYLLADGLLEVTATDVIGLLGSWISDTSFTYRGATVKFLVERVCALAGVHTVTFDAFPGWTQVVAAYTHPIGQSALYSLSSLTDLVPFEYVPQEDGSLKFYVPTTGPASVYTFGLGAGEHNAWLSRAPTSLNWGFDAPPWFGAGDSITYLQDIGSPPLNRVAEAIDQGALNATGRRLSLIINDRRLITDPAATAAANALLVAEQESKHVGIFAAPPSFSLEPGDVINFSGATYAATAGPWRVEQIAEHFNVSGPEPFHQVISVRGTA